MTPKSQLEHYHSFIEFIRKDIQRERFLVHRRMFSVFLWCFLVPAATSITVLTLVKFNILPPSARGYLDWLALIFPIFYSLYILSSEVISQLPSIFKRGGVSGSLNQAVKEGAWREKVCHELGDLFPAKGSEWDSLIANFEMDLQILQYRTRYLTALAGAVFFLLMQGIDSLSDAPEKMAWVKNPLLGWVETTSGDLSQFIGLALFLVLLYLSGNQTYHSLTRYLNCAKLVRLRLRQTEAA